MCFDGGNKRTELSRVDAIGRRYCAKTFDTANLLCHQVGQIQLSLLIWCRTIGGKFSASA